MSLRPRDTYQNKMVVEAAKIYDAKARIFLLEQKLIKTTELKTIREVINEISSLEKIIEVNKKKLAMNIYTRAPKSENIPSWMNREFKITG